MKIGQSTINYSTPTSQRYFYLHLNLNINRNIQPDQNIEQNLRMTDLQVKFMK